MTMRKKGTKAPKPPLARNASGKSNSFSRAPREKSQKGARTGMRGGSYNR